VLVPLAPAGGPACDGVYQSLYLLAFAAALIPGPPVPIPIAPPTSPYAVVGTVQQAVRPLVDAICAFYS
jgi:hypothetical protein